MTLNTVEVLVEREEPNVPRISRPNIANFRRILARTKTDPAVRGLNHLEPVERAIRVNVESNSGSRSDLFERSADISNEKLPGDLSDDEMDEIRGNG